MEAISVTFRFRLILFFVISFTLSLFEVYFALRIKNTVFIIVSLIGLALLLPVLATVLALWEEVWVQIVKSFKRKRIEKISPLDAISSNIFIRRVSNLPILSRIVQFIAGRLRENALKAGIYIHAESLITLVLLITIVMLGLTLILILVSTYVPVIPLYIKNLITSLTLVLPILSLILVLSPYVYIQIVKVNRISDIDDELPFFAVYASIIQEAGLNLYQAFERIVGRGVFKTLETEAKHVIRLFTFFTHNPLEALDEYADFNPNSTLKNMIKGYSSILKSGGEVSKYLGEFSEKLLEKYVSRWKGYVQTVTTFGELLIAIFTLFPTLFILGAIAFSQPLSKMFIILYTAAGVPTITIIVYALVNQFQPRSRDNTRLPVKIIIISVVLLFGTYYLLNNIVCLKDQLTIIVLSIIVFLTPVTVASRVILYEIKSIESALPQFLRDITEYVKIGYDITQALERIASTRSYNRLFDSIVLSISRLLKMNVPFRVIVESIESRCWMLKYSLFIISELAVVGALTPQPLERLCSAIEKTLNSKYEAKSALTTYSILSYITPLFLALLVYFTSNIILGISSFVGGIPLVNIKLVKEIIDLTSILTISIAVALGILLAKLKDQTISSTIHVLILLALTLIAIKIPELIPIHIIPLPRIPVKP